MRLPHVKFVISKARDVETFFAFAREAEVNKGTWFARAIFRDHPELRTILSGPPYRRAQVAKFVTQKYRQQRELIQRGMQTIERDWKLFEKPFDRLVTELFGDADWPAGKYVCFPTIWGMYPRFLDSKMFQVPFAHLINNYARVVIAHELLHFKFYDFFKKNFPEYPNPESDMFVWRVSEIFNSAICNSRKWLAVFHTKNMIYDDMKQDIDAVRRRLKGKQLTAMLLTEAILSVVKEA